MPEQASPQINWKRVFWMVAAAVVILAIVILLWWWFFLRGPKEVTNPASRPPTKISTPSATPSAKKDETAGWEVYKNTDLGFQLKYPSEVKVGSIAYSSGSGGNAILGIRGPTQGEGTDVHVVARAN